MILTSENHVFQFCVVWRVDITPLHAQLCRYCLLFKSVCKSLKRENVERRCN